MEKKNNSILVITLVIFILATICLSSYIVYDKFIKKEEKSIVKSEIKEEPAIENETQIEISDEDIIDIGVTKFQRYVNMSNVYYAGSPEKLLIDLGLIDSNELQNLKENDNFLQTNIKWTDFKNQILKYISENLFNKNESSYYLNDNGNLKFLGAGKGGATFTVINSKILDKKSNSYTILVNGTESWITENVTKSYKFELIKEDNWVIDNISEYQEN